MGYNNNDKDHDKQYKKSGATYTKSKKGTYKGITHVNAWNMSKSRGLTTAFIYAYNKTAEHTNDNGNTYVTMMAEISCPKLLMKKRFPCLMNADTGVVNLDEIGMCISPKGEGVTRSGKKVTGYFGTNQGRK